MMNYTRLILGASMLCWPAVAYSQSASSSANTAPTAAVTTDTTPPTATSDQELGDIVVTAQKRSENLQRVPLAVSALSAESLTNRGIASIENLDGQVPNLRISRSVGVANVSLRGIGTTTNATGVDGSVAFHLDGVYISRSRAQLVGFFDVDRVEVLRGPQGTLYGRNATGGSINVSTRKPTSDFQGYVTLDYGNYDRREARAAVGGPISDTLQFRVAGIHLQHDGFGRNLANGRQVDDQNEDGVRGELRFVPDAGYEALLTIDHYDLADASGGFKFLGNARAPTGLSPLFFGGVYPASTNPYDINSEVQPALRMRTTGVSLSLTAPIAEHLSAKSISGYRQLTSNLFTDIDATQIPYVTLFNAENSKQYSEELQLNLEHGRLTWLVGGYYFHEDIFGSINVPFMVPVFPPGARFNTTGRVKTDAYAAFTHIEYAVTDRLKLTGGLRYSSETKRSMGTTVRFLPVESFDNKKSWDALTPRFAIDYQLSDRILAYAAVERGFKSGQFIAGDSSPPANPEYVWSYEAGLKSRFLDNRLQLNLAAFYYDYKDLQVQRVVGTNSITENAATARSYGAEAEMLAKPWRGLTAGLNIAYLNARFTQYRTADPVFPELGEQSWAGAPLPNAPDWTVAANIEQVIPVGGLGEVAVASDATWTDRLYFNPFGQSYTSQGPVALWNARITIRPDRLDGVTISGWVRNITDRRVVSNAIISSDFIGYPRDGTLKDPRTYGVSVGFTF